VSFLDNLPKFRATIAPCGSVVYGETAEDLALNVFRHWREHDPEQWEQEKADDNPMVVAMVTIVEAEARGFLTVEVVPEPSSANAEPTAQEPTPEVK